MNGSKPVRRAAACLLGICLAGCGGQSEEEPETGTAGSSPIAAPVEYLGAVGQAKNYSRNRAGLESVQQAVRLFQAGEGRLPSGLQELITEGYLSALPGLSPGHSFAYSGRTGAVTVQKD